MTPPKKIWVVMSNDRPVAAYAIENDAEIYTRRNNGEHEIVPVVMIDNATWSVVDHIDC